MSDKTDEKNNTSGIASQPQTPPRKKRALEKARAKIAKMKTPESSAPVEPEVVKKTPVIEEPTQSQQVMQKMLDRRQKAKQSREEQLLTRKKREARSKPPETQSEPETPKTVNRSRSKLALHISL